MKDRNEDTPEANQADNHGAVTKREDLKLLTLNEAASFLNLKISRLRYEIFKKSIVHFKVGRSIRFSEKDLISWIMSQKQEPRGMK